MVLIYVACILRAGLSDDRSINCFSIKHSRNKVGDKLCCRVHRPTEEVDDDRVEAFLELGIALERTLNTTREEIGHLVQGEWLRRNMEWVSQS